MTIPDVESCEFEWHDYYQKFNYFNKDIIRAGCQPLIMEHEHSSNKSIVIVHGLSDSPHFMKAIGSYFFHELNYNVYIPLLHCHGLQKPNGMESVELEEWKANVSYAIRTASLKSEEVSIGGLSTGGTLSFYATVTNPNVNGDLFLFSAAVDLAGGRTGLIGEIKERLLRSFLSDVLDENKKLIGDNPFRYTHVDFDGGSELAKLIKETDILIDGFSNNKPFDRRVFAAHSECDTTAHIDGVKRLQSVSVPKKFKFYRLPKDLGVSHASIVLHQSIRYKNETLEKSNPVFEEMMSEVFAFSTK